MTAKPHFKLRLDGSIVPADKHQPRRKYRTQAMPQPESFSNALLRLKVELNAHLDAEVAAALGMTRGAFSERKRRNSFPVDKVVGLNTKRPSSPIDWRFMLTGQRGAQ